MAEPEWIKHPGSRAELCSHRIFIKLLAWLALLSPVVQPAHADLVVDTANLQLSFSDWGDLLEARACLTECRSAHTLTQDYRAYRGLLSINRDSDFIYELERIDGDHSVQLIFRNLVSEEVRRWIIPHSGWLLSLSISHPRALSLTSGGSFSPDASHGFAGWLESLRYAVLDKGKLNQHGLDEELGPFAFSAGWLGYRNRFWTAMLKTDDQFTVKLHGGRDQAEAQLDLSPDSSEPGRFLLYIGPVEPAALATAMPELSVMMYSGLWPWLAWISHLLFRMLAAIQSVIPVWGVAVVLLSLSVQIVMYPLTRFAERVQGQVLQTEARLDPQLSFIKANFKGGVQAEKILDLYRRENVHPLYSLKSIVGLVVVVPVFIGAFNMLAENIWLSSQSFLWIDDLSRPDSIMDLPLSVPFLGGDLSLLPFIMTALNVPAALLQGVHLESVELRKRHKQRSWITAIVFLLLFYTFPAAMVLYWTVNNLFALVLAGRRFQAGQKTPEG